ncbi:MAG: hypothetical protein JRH11_02405 [Deltaproteobacteria bacterium]|nr:hypothetical protein [Deltaproteobacteria bacterium]
MSRRRAPTKIPLWAYVPERLLSMARVAALVAAALAIVLSVWGYRARAQLTERLIDTGSAMLHYDGATRQDARRTLVFNGQRIHLSSGKSPHDLHQVLDFYEGHCLDHDGGLMHELDSFVADHPEVQLNTDAMDPILRTESGGRGVVACLYMEATDGTKGFMERYHRYAGSGDLSEIGDMRYIYAEEDKDEDGGTHFVAFWTDGPFVLREMLPAEGDAPGQDIRDVERPDGLRRFLSVHEAGAPQAMTVYVSEEDGPTETDVEQFYRETLVRGGWRLLEGEAPTPAASLTPLTQAAPRVLAAERSERMVTLIFSSSDEHRAVTTILEAR